ncbi:MAG: chemotaxis protein CheW [Candidatus Scalinduaceae bacterium]
MGAVAEKKDIKSYEGKFLTFALSNEEYGIEILKVREIIGIMEITPVPQTPDYMKGVINLRGKVIPIIDLRLKFSMPEVGHTKETCIIVAEVGTAQVGVIVDSVSEVTDIKGEDIEEAPNFGQEIDTSFIMGLGKTKKKKIIILLDIEKVLTTEELKMAEQIATE